MPGKKAGRKKIKGTRMEEFIKKPKSLPRDPLAPKPKKGAYMYYAEEQRRKFATQTEPKLDFQAAGTLIGKTWHELGAEGKKPFEALAAEDSARFSREMVAYTPSAEFTAELEAAKKKAKYQPRLKDDPAAPSKPQSAYLFYTAEQRPLLAKDPNYKDKSITELSAVMGRTWSAMADEHKERFVQMAEADKARYEMQLKTYKPTPAWVEAKEYLEARRANAQALLEAEERKKNRPPPGDPKAAAAAMTEKVKKRKATSLQTQKKKLATAHKIASAALTKASKLRAKYESDEAKAKVKMLMLETKLNTAADDLEKLGAKKRKNAKPDPPPLGIPAPPAAQLLNLSEDF